MVYKLEFSTHLVFMALLQVIFQPALSEVLFTVEAEKTAYKSEFGGNVVMGCKFDNKPSGRLNNLSVAWSWIESGSKLDVIRIENGVERLGSPEYRGRVKLLTDELNGGWAKLEISRLTIKDCGTYRCLVHTERGADYKTLSLSVTAPYKTVFKHIERVAGADQVLLTCRSEGWPESRVAWRDAHMQTYTGNTTVVSKPGQLIQISSRIQVGSSEENNYTCSFTNDGTSTTFHIPDEISSPSVKHHPLIITLCVVVTMLLVTAGAFAYRQKGFRNVSTRNLLAGKPLCPTAACESQSPAPSAHSSAPQIEAENENEATAFNDVRICP